jgi:Tfp pilus assembly protein FimT
MHLYFICGLENIMSLNYRDKKYEAPALSNRESGFSMVELMIVCVIMVVIAGLAIPNIYRAFRNYQLDSAGHSVASLLQEARMQAVKTNLPAYANFSNGTSVNTAFVTNDPANTTVAAGNPEVQISPAITFQTAPPDHGQLDAFLGTNTPQVAVSIGFNARGLPCTETGGNPTVCGAATSGFEWFMQSIGGWEAVTVTPSGRIKSWRLSQQTGGASVCGYAACWI